MISYEALTAKGALIRTFSDRRTAMRWVADNAPAYPGIELHEVERIEHRHRVYRPRPVEVHSNVTPLRRRA